MDEHDLKHQQWMDNQRERLELLGCERKDNPYGPPDLLVIGAVALFALVVILIAAAVA